MADEPVVVVDLEKCPYFDSSGLSVLVRFRKRNNLVVSVPPNFKVRRIFDITNLTSVINISSTEAEALRIARELMKTPPTPTEHPNR